MSSESDTKQAHHEQGQGGGMSYWRFGAMIATAVVVMYGVMYIDSYALDHLTWSESMPHDVTRAGRRTATRPTTTTDL